MKRFLMDNKSIRSKKFFIAMNSLFFHVLLSCILLAGCTAKEVPTSMTKEGTVQGNQFRHVFRMPTHLLPKEPRYVEMSNNVHPLTGLPLPEGWEGKRPIAFVFNNLKKALPQSGISQMDLYYEVLAEAGITRIIGIAQDPTSEKIGPIRSTRHYFLDFALDQDAIFVHHGGSPLGYEYIKKYHINDLDGMALEGTTFFRDWDRARARGLEHSSYTASSKITAAIAQYQYPTVHPDGYKSPFLFYSKDTPISETQNAKTVTVPFSDMQTSIFVYDDTTGEYLRYQGEDKHMDEENNQQLSVKNILVQQVAMQVIDDEGRRDVALTGSGKGYLFSDGNAVEITWEKKDLFSPTTWYDVDGNPLAVNKGKTWICVFNKEQIIEFH